MYDWIDRVLFVVAIGAAAFALAAALWVVVVFNGLARWGQALQFGDA